MSGAARAACSVSGWLVLGKAGACLSEEEYGSLGALAVESYELRGEDGGLLLIRELPVAEAPAPKPQGAQAPGPAGAPELPAGMRLVSLRAHLAEAGPAEAALACRAVHLTAFRRRTRFCPSCSARLEPAPVGTSLRCPACGLEEFPRVSPAVIVLAERKGRILLARNARFQGGMHSLIAGFVEPGESFEECAARELLEETGISAEDFRYSGSQPWPFPDSIMVGFRARALEGSIRVDGREILEAGWFGPEAMPPIPRRGSIARRLIDGWLAERGFTTA